MNSDKWGNPSYAQLMDEQRPYITLTLDLRDPIELHDFVDLFASIGSQYERYLKTEYPDAKGEARIFIHEIRKGSIIADLFPGGLGDLIKYMDDVLIVTGFSYLLAKTIKVYLAGKRNPNATKSDLKDYLGIVRAVADDSDGKAVIETTTYKEGLLSREVVFTFNTQEARDTAKHIEDHRQDLERVTAADHSRVLMVFKRSDVGDVAVGKRSGERVIIEEISETDFALVYASDLAEERIKHEIRETEDNIYHKGFVVDVNVRFRGGKQVAYAVTNVHQVIDLPRDDE